MAQKSQAAHKDGASMFKKRSEKLDLFSIHPNELRQSPTSAKSSSSKTRDRHDGRESVAKDHDVSTAQPKRSLALTNTRKPRSSHRQDRNNGAETLSIKYNFDGLQRYAADLSTKVDIHEHILKSFNQELVLLERSQMSAQTMALSKNTQYDTEFLREQSYNMSIIDLKTDSEVDHLNITRFLKSSLLHSSGGTRKPMIIHIFCYHGSQTLTPLHLSVILLQSILKRLYRNRYIDWKPIEVVCNGIDQKWVDYEITMELLKVLISRVLKDYPEDTMHFVFGGIRSSHLDEKQRLGLARFMIAMGGLVRTVLPQGDMGKVKCAFSGNALFEGVLSYLESERAKTRGVPEQEEIFGQMLMLALYKDGYQNFYYERVRFSE